MNLNQDPNSPIDQSIETGKNDTQPMNDEVLIRAENVGKVFCRDLKRSLFYGFRDGIGDIIPGVRKKYDCDGNPIMRKGEFWANRGISFELRRGECLGLIGHNGAGKTTLLKMLNGLIKPDTGKIEMRGRTGALIALGAGFNPILTGRENVYIAGAVYGLSTNDIDDKYDEIVEFSGLAEFMETPVQSYSSGMKVRLGFAVASTINPDILLIDEVLAVGDPRFKVKCLNRISKLLQTTAVIFVSHNTNQVSLICNRCLVLSQGEMLGDYPTDEAMQLYNGLNVVNLAENVILSESILSFELSFDDLEVTFGDSLSFVATINSGVEFNNCYIRLMFIDMEQSVVAEWNSKLNEEVYQLKEGTNIFKCETPSLRFKAGIYRLRFVFLDETGAQRLLFSEPAETLQMSGYIFGRTCIQL